MDLPIARPPNEVQGSNGDGAGQVDCRGPHSLCGYDKHKSVSISRLAFEMEDDMRRYHLLI